MEQPEHCVISLPEVIARPGRSLHNFTGSWLPGSLALRRRSTSFAWRKFVGAHPPDQLFRHHCLMRGSTRVDIFIAAKQQERTERASGCMSLAVQHMFVLWCRMPAMPCRLLVLHTGLRGTTRVLPVRCVHRNNPSTLSPVAFSCTQVARLVVRLPQVLGLSPDGNLKKTVRCDTLFLHVCIR